MSIFANEVNEYLLAIKRGDITQLEPLYDLFRVHVSGVARYYLADKSYCDDVTIEAFQKVILYINSYEEGKDGYNWICRIAQHIAYNYNEKMSKISGAAELAIAKKFADTDFTKHTEERLDLFQAIDILETESRELIYMHFFMGKSFKEIADKLHLSKAGVKKRIDKILLKLKIFIETGNC